MRVLAIESSCDETAAAIIGEGEQVLSEVVYSQVEEHRRFGGVVPEIASRKHLEKVGPVVDQALANAGLDVADLDGIAVTCCPGLIGALLVGVGYARGLALGRGLPLTGVHHLEGHLGAAFLGGNELEQYPFIGLVVSGGHSAIYLAESFGRYRVLGQTRDDAAGEAYDKVARLLGLGYPGGRAIDERARRGDAARFRFPRPMWSKGGYDLSFAGLKTAVAQHLAAHPGHAEGQELLDVCASFQEAVAQVLVKKTLAAARDTGARLIVLSGGVAANSRLRSLLTEGAASQRVPVALPGLRHCMDNAAMIGLVGRRYLLAGKPLPVLARSRAPLPAVL